MQYLIGLLVCIPSLSFLWPHKQFSADHKEAYSVTLTVSSFKYTPYFFPPSIVSHECPTTVSNILYIYKFDTRKPYVRMSDNQTSQYVRMSVLIHFEFASVTNKNSAPSSKQYIYLTVSHRTVSLSAARSCSILVVKTYQQITTNRRMQRCPQTRCIPIWVWPAYLCLASFLWPKFQVEKTRLDATIVLRSRTGQQVCCCQWRIGRVSERD